MHCLILNDTDVRHNSSVCFGLCQDQKESGSSPFFPHQIFLKTKPQNSLMSTFIGVTIFHVKECPLVKTIIAVVFYSDLSVTQWWGEKSFVCYLWYVKKNMLELEIRYWAWKCS